MSENSRPNIAVGITPFLELEQEKTLQKPKSTRYQYQRMERGIRKRTRIDGKGTAAFDVQIWSEGKALSKTFGTITEARSWRARQAGARASGRRIVQAQPRLKLKDFVDRQWDEWLSEEVTMGNLRESTAIWYRYGALHVLREIGAVRMGDLSKEVLRGMLSRRIDRGDSSSKLRQIRATTRSILSLAVEQNVIAIDPSDFMTGRNAPKAVRNNQQPLRAWSESEVQRFMGFIRGDEFEALWVLLLTTGLRRGEALALTWGAVDLTNGTVTVTESLSIVGREMLLQEPKTASSRRTIAIGPVTVSALKDHRRHQNEARLASGPRDVPDRVFADAAGSPLRPDHVTKRLKSLVRKAGLEWIRLHGLRHTMASIALQNGTDIATVSQRLGHANTHVTARIYLHGSKESDRQVAFVLDQLLYG